MVGVEIKKVQTERMPNIRRVKINHIHHSFAGNISNHPFNDIAFGVNDSHSFSLFYVGNGQINDSC